MTLNTRIFIDSDVDRRFVFSFCQGLLAEHDEHNRTPDQQNFEESTLGGSKFLMNRGWQDLPAWLMIGHNDGNPLRTAEQVAEHDEDCNIPGNTYYDADRPDCDGTSGHAHRPASWLDVSFDTGYGYHNEKNGWDCTALHTYFIVRLGQWLDEKGIPWTWQNEYTGEYHTGYDALKEFNFNGGEAATWFADTVLPMIKSGALFEKESE